MRHSLAVYTEGSVAQYFSAHCGHCGGRLFDDDFESSQIALLSARLARAALNLRDTP